MDGLGQLVDNEPWRIAVEADDDGRRRRQRTMLGDERWPAIAAEHVEVAVVPGVQVAGPAERLARICGARLPDVVDEDDGDTVLALQGAEEAEQVADLGRGVLVAAMQADERVEDQHAGPVRGDREDEAAPVARIVEVQRRRTDPADAERIEVDAAGLSRDRRRAS